MPAIHFPDSNPSFSNEELAVYGFGSAGKQIVDSLLDSGANLKIIIDKSKGGTPYRGVPIASLSNLRTVVAPDRLKCLITLHNHYVNIGEVYRDLSESGFKEIYSLVNAREFSNDVVLKNGYWLDFSFSFEKHKDKIEDLKNLLSDTQSRALLDGIQRYREFGHIPDCPLPSFFDEYTPAGLPKYKQPLKIIDCGAFTGVAIEKFISAGYEIDSFIAFEPDLENFEKLAKKQFKVNSSIRLPLGAWSSNTQLRFNNNGAMSSSIDEAGNTIIQCVRIDSVINGFAPNLIKFDVEGAEIDALNGLEETIRSHKPNLCVSLYHRPHHLFEIPLLINSWNIGYRFYIRVHEFNTFGVVLYCLNDDLIAA
jgi:FkbM family methyltransferase